jgi:hypothetical protein
MKHEEGKVLKPGQRIGRMSVSVPFELQVETEVLEWTRGASQTMVIGEGLGGTDGLLALLELTATGVWVSETLVIGNGVNLSRAQATGIVYTKPARFGR